MKFKVTKIEKGCRKTRHEQELAWDYTTYNACVVHLEYEDGTKCKFDWYPEKGQLTDDMIKENAQRIQRMYREQKRGEMEGTTIVNRIDQAKRFVGQKFATEVVEGAKK